MTNPDFFSLSLFSPSPNTHACMLSPSLHLLCFNLAYSAISPSWPHCSFLPHLSLCPTIPRSILRHSLPLVISFHLFLLWLTAASPPVCLPLLIRPPVSPSSPQDVAMAGLWTVGSSLDVESTSAFRGDRFCWTAAGGHLQQEVSDSFNLCVAFALNSAGHHY